MVAPPAAPIAAPLPTETPGSTAPATAPPAAPMPAPRRICPALCAKAGVPKPSVKAAAKTIFLTVMLLSYSPLLFPRLLHRDFGKGDRFPLGLDFRDRNGGPGR